MEKFNLYEFLDKKVAKSPALNFLNPVMNWLNAGNIFKQPISIIYILMALIYAIVPIYFIYIACKIGDMLEFCDILVVIFAIIFSIGGGVFAFRYWIERCSEVGQLTKNTDDYVAVPIISHFIKSSGECSGIWFIFVGGMTSIFALIFDSQIANYLLGDSNIFVFILGGIGSIVISRVIAELLSAICSIANNTKK